MFEGEVPTWAGIHQHGDPIHLLLVQAFKDLESCYQIGPATISAKGLHKEISTGKYWLQGPEALDALQHSLCCQDKLPWGDCKSTGWRAPFYAHTGASWHVLHACQSQVTNVSRAAVCWPWAPSIDGKLLIEAKVLLVVEHIRVRMLENRWDTISKYLCKQFTGNITHEMEDWLHILLCLLLFWTKALKNFPYLYNL